MKIQTMMLDFVVVPKSPYHLSLLLYWLLLSSFTIDGIGIEKVNNNDEIKCLDKEKEALLELKNGIKVDRCGFLASWGNQDENKDCCNWQGVRCNQHTGNVIMLDLPGVNTYEPCMEGNISPSLLELKHLNYLDLSYNGFQGQAIPSFIGSLTELEHLNLSYSGFWGEVPPQLGNLSNLQSLHLSCISLYPYCQHVENLWWLSHLTQLSHLDVINIDLSKATDSIQVINTLPYLTFLRMNTCKLPSPSPSIRKMSSRHTQSSISLQVLDLGNNNLNSSIYQWLFKSSDQFGIRELEMISLSHNQIEGPLPDALGNLPALQYLDLSANHIECPIPDTIGNLKNLIYLDLSENNLQGCTLPNTFGNLCSLQSLLLANINLKEELSSFVQRLCAHKSSMVLDLRGNQLWGSLPDFFNVYPSMKVLYVDDNHLNGTISKSIGQLSELERLSLSSNSLKDTLSDLHFERLYKLQYLDLSNNSLLVLNFNANWVPPFQLDAIRLRSCNLGPHFPQWLQTQNSFSYLDISDAGISEAIPTSFLEQLTNLQVIISKYVSQ